MKIFVLTILSTIPYVFLKSINTSELKENLNLFKSENGNYSSPLHSTLVDFLSKRLLPSSLWSNIKQDHTSLFVLVLNIFTQDKQECESFLQEICNDLLKKLLKGSFADILETICTLKKIHALCQDLTESTISKPTSIQRKCQDLNSRLNEFFNSNEDLLSEGSNKKLSITDCENYSTYCNIYQRVCGITTSNLCGRFQNACYLKYRENFRNIFLSLILKDSLQVSTLENHQECVDDLRRKCHCVIGLGPDIVESCLQVWNTCKSLVESIGGTCLYLNLYIQNLLSRNSKHTSGYGRTSSEKECLLATYCDYYTLFCNDRATKTLCTGLKQRCAGKAVDMPFVKQIELGECSSVFENVNLDSFFSQAQKSGILFPHKAPYLSAIILIISSLMPHRGDLQEKCRIFLEYHCDYYRTTFLNLDKYCSKGYNEECEHLNSKAEVSCSNLKSIVQELGLISGQDVSVMVHSGMASDYITVSQCLSLIYQCAYFAYICENIQNMCKNVRVLCYNLGIQKYYMNTFWGKFNKDILLAGPNNFNLRLLLTEDSGILEYIMTICSELGGSNEVIFTWCLYPATISRKLYYYLVEGYKELEKDLPKPNEQPSLSECIYYIAECNGLSNIFPKLKDSCTRLENKCFGYNYKDGFENIEPIKLT